MRRCDDQAYTLSGISGTTAIGPVRGGRYLLNVSGTLGGATVTLDYLGDGTNYTTVTDATSNTKLSFTAAVAYSGVDLPAGQYRIGITGGAGVAANVSLVGLG
jgi:hypothetical protein